MGQAANSNRNASLDDKKIRAAGRATERGEIRKAVNTPMKGQTGGAFGSGGKAKRAPAARTSRAARKRKG